jgi:ribosome-associated translation inhibitor RaiA
MKIESMNIQRILDSIKDLKQYQYEVVINYNQHHYVTNVMRSCGKDEPEALEALKQKLSKKIDKLKDKRGEYKVESIKLIL